jgi:hypothetical protein
MPALRSDQIPDLLRETPSPWGDAVEVGVEDSEARTDVRIADLVIRISWDGVSRRFVAETKTRSIPSELDRAVEQARRSAEATGLPPMVIVPYIAERQMQTLIKRQVSALDLSGNGLIILPGSLLLVRTGKPNRFPESLPARFAYRGSTSIVPRAFLLRPSYESVKQIGEEIKSRGGQVALSTVSKALTRMEEDVLIRRDERGIRLVQPEELLERLATNFRSSRSCREFDLRTELPIDEIFRLCPEDVELTLTGTSSMSQYAVGGRGDTPAVYCSRASKLRGAIGAAWNETDRFADLRVIETRDKELYFDAQTSPDGVVFASDIQTFIELSAGDKRDQQMAQQVRERLLANVLRQGGEKQ